MHPKEAYAKMSAAMNATGRHMHLNMCEWGKENPWEWGDHIAQSWRMSGDHTGVWSSTKQQIRESAAIPANYTGRPFGWNDMDMLETGNYKQAAHANHRESNMTSIEYHTEFSMWAISASPLVVTTPIMNCTAAQSKADGGAPVTCRGWISELQRSILLNSEVLAINQDVTPQGRPVKEQDLRVWARHLSDGSVAVALYNEQDVAQRITVAFTDLGWDASTRASIRDLWAKADEGTFVGKYPIDGGASVAPHATRLLRLTRSTRA
jgi:alpha-galactosidase